MLNASQSIVIFHQIYQTLLKFTTFTYIAELLSVISVTSASESISCSDRIHYTIETSSRLSIACLPEL